jgi:hypothetical protein
LFGIGAAGWFNTAADLTRIVSPSGTWLKREARYNTLAIYLMTTGALVVVSGVVLGVGKWLIQ